MEENKQLISELLLLKTGLSILSDEADKIIEAEKTYQEKSETLSYTKDSIESKKRWYKERKAVADKQGRELAAYKAKEASKRSMGTLAILGAVVLFIVGAKLMTSSVSTGLLCILSAIGCLIFGSSIRNPGQFKRVKGPDVRAKVDFERTEKHDREEIRKLEAEYPVVLDEYEAAKANYEKVYGETYPVALVLYETLYQNFNDTLRVRDWQYLDLVIHYLDSERADTKKEALLLVDRQVQNNEIVAAINQASAEICNTIRTVGDLIRFDMQRHFTALSTQLASQHQKMMTQLDGMAASNRAVADKLGAIATNQAMQTALLGKINVTSQKLAEDASFISRYSRKYY